MESGNAGTPLFKQHHLAGLHKISGHPYIRKTEQPGLLRQSGFLNFGLLSMALIGKLSCITYGINPRPVANVLLRTTFCSSDSRSSPHLRWFLGLSPFLTIPQLFLAVKLLSHILSAWFKDLI